MCLLVCFFKESSPPPPLNFQSFRAPLPRRRPWRALQRWRRGREAAPGGGCGLVGSGAALGGRQRSQRGSQQLAGGALRLN